MNASAERLVRAVRGECPDRMLSTGERHRHMVIFEYLAHYNSRGSHHGHAMSLPAPGDDPDATASPVPPAQIQRRTQLAGLINQYQQAA